MVELDIYCGQQMLNGICSAGVMEGRDRLMTLVSLHESNDTIKWWTKSTFDKLDMQKRGLDAEYDKWHWAIAQCHLSYSADPRAPFLSIFAAMKGLKT